MWHTFKTYFTPRRSAWGKQRLFWRMVFLILFLAIPFHFAITMRKRSEYIILVEYCRCLFQVNRLKFCNPFRTVFSAWCFFPEIICVLIFFCISLFTVITNVSFRIIFSDYLFYLWFSFLCTSIYHCFWLQILFIATAYVYFSCAYYNF